MPTQRQGILYASILVGVGAAIGYFAASDGVGGGSSVALAGSPESDPVAASRESTASARGDEAVVPITLEGAEPAIPLYTKDPTLNMWKERRPDLSAGREPGPINVQRMPGGFYPSGIPTFYRSPVALTPEDLRVGEVDVAMIGAYTDNTIAMRGAAYGPTMFRAMSDVYGGWGSYSQPQVHTMIDLQEDLTIVDYGDAPNEPYNAERTVHEVRKLVAEIAGVQLPNGNRVIPIIIGGDHSLAYPDLAGLADVFGKGNVGMLHFDAHYDGSIVFGQYGHNGAFTKRLIAEGHIEGKNYIQIGLRGWYPDEATWRWMRENQIKYHTMGEFERIGWEGVFEKVMKEVAAGPKYWFISFDVDAIDPAYAPGCGSPEPNGLTTPVVFRMVRRLCAETNVIGMDLVEFNPLRDPSWLTGQLVNRIVREALVGVALRKKGITDADYESELTRTHGQD